MQTAAVTCVAVRWRDRADANCPLPISPQSLPLLTPRMTGDQCRYAYSASELWTHDWRLWCIPAENRASFVNKYQISTLCVSLSVHTSVIPASVCPAYQLDHHVACRRRDAFWCLLCLAVSLYVVATVVDSRYPGGRLFGAPKLVCAKQWLLEECTTAAADTAGEDREAKEQMGPPAKRQRVDNAQPDSLSVLDACLNQFLSSADKR